MKWSALTPLYSYLFLTPPSQGLGKTLQTISFLGYLKHNQKTNVQHLVVVPKSTLANWAREFQHWVPDFDVVVLQGDKDARVCLPLQVLLFRC